MTAQSDELAALAHDYWEGVLRRNPVLATVGLTEREIVNEVDRYIVWPGQALAYKVGQREIEAARRDRQAALGQRFDLRAFHDELLRHGALPLSSLRTVVTG